MVDLDNLEDVAKQLDKWNASAAADLRAAIAEIERLRNDIREASQEIRAVAEELKIEQAHAQDPAHLPSILTIRRLSAGGVLVCTLIETQAEVGPLFNAIVEACDSLPETLMRYEGADAVAQLKALMGGSSVLSAGDTLVLKVGE